jgi:hypothetical protein
MFKKLKTGISQNQCHYGKIIQYEAKEYGRWFRQHVTWVLAKNKCNFDARNLFGNFLAIFSTFLEAGGNFGHEPWQASKFWFGHKVPKLVILETALGGILRGPI